MTARVEILFLAHRIPYPPNKGDKIRSWRLVEHLAKRFDVHLCAFVDDPADFVHEARLKEVCASVFLAPLKPVAARMRSLAALARGAAFTFAYFRDGRMQAAVDAVRARDLAFEFVFSSAMAPYVAEPASGRPRIVDLCDADSEKWRQYGEEGSGPMRKVHAREGARLAAAEIEIINAMDATFAASPAEAAIFNAREGITRTVDWFGNGVDIEAFAPRGERAAPSVAAGAVFVGDMGYRANAEAALWFAREVWPAVRARLPEARFAIVGRKPDSATRALNGRNGIVVTGEVDDVRPYLQHARAVVAPLKVARGVQNKVLEAMAIARPVVATSGAAAGIEARAGEELLIADEPADIAVAVAWLIAEPRRGDAIGASARARMKADYSWPAQLARLDAALARLGV